MAVARAVELHEKNLLPRAEKQSSGRNQDCRARTYKRCFDVRIGITLGMAIIAALRNLFLKKREDISHHIGVGTLVDCDASGCVGDINNRDSIIRRDLPDSFGDFRGDIDSAIARMRPNIEALDAQILTSM